MVVRPGPSFSVADVCRGWTRAFGEFGVEVGDLNYDDIFDFYVRARLQLDADDSHKRKRHVQAMTIDDAMHAASRQILAQAFKFWPDVVFIVSGFWVPTEVCDVLRARGMTVVLLCTESPYQDDQQYVMAGHCDIVLLNDPTNLERFQAVHPNVRYVPHAYDPAVHHPGPAGTRTRMRFCVRGDRLPVPRPVLRAGRLDGHRRQTGGPVGVRRRPDPRTVRDPSAPRMFLQRRHRPALPVLPKCRRTCIGRKRTSRTSSTAGRWAPAKSSSPRPARSSCGNRAARATRSSPCCPTFTEPDEFGDLLRFYLEREDLRPSSPAKPATRSASGRS